MAQSALQKLVCWLNEVIARADRQTALPAASKIAADFGISRSTVERAMTRFVANGLLKRIPGKGTFVKWVEPQPMDLQEPRSSIDTLVAALKDGIASGTLRAGYPLPTSKHIRLEFGVSPLTVRMACRKLESMNLVWKSGRQHVVGRTPEFGMTLRRRRGEIYFLTNGANCFREVFVNDLLAVAYRKMEKEVLGHGIGIRYDDCENLETLALSWSRNQQAPAGVMMWRQDQRIIDPLIPSLRKILGNTHLGPMRVLIDWRDAITDNIPHRAGILSQGNIITTAARALVHFARDHRYRRIHFLVSPYDLIWGITPFRVLAKIRAELRSTIIDVSYRFFVLHGSQTQPVTLLAETENRAILELLLSKYSPVSLETFAGELTVVPDFAQMMHGCERKILLVCSSAETAVRLREQLAMKQLRTPNDVSIICLEDAPAYYHHGFSVCAPDLDRIGYLMAHYMIGDTPIVKSSKGFLRVSSRVVEKMTT